MNEKYEVEMNIEIEKIKIKVSEEEFKSEVFEFAKRFKKAYPRSIAVSYKEFKKHFKLKITELEFIELCRRLNIKMYSEERPDCVCMSNLNL